jgi:hypothetical protein
MCPFCVANMAMLAAGVTSTGGVTAFVARKLFAQSRGKNTAKPSSYPVPMKTRLLSLANSSRQSQQHPQSR